MNTPARATYRYDPFAAEFRADPYPAFAALREACPVHRYVLPAVEVEKINSNPLVARPTAEFYSISRYSDVLAGVQDHNTFASGQGPGPERAQPPDGVGMLISADEPHHARQRRIVVQAFNPRAIEALRPELAAICDRLIDGFAEDGRVDLVPRYTVQVPIEALSLMLGVSTDDRDKFKRWTDDTLKAFGGDPEAYEASYQSLMEFTEYFMAIITERRAALDRGQTPPDDILNRLLHADYGDRPFTDPELIMCIQVLLVAGSDTVNHAIGNGVHLLLTHPEARALLEREPERWGLAVEEILRFESPAQALFRNTRTETEVAGCPIPADAKVRMLFAAANRDPEVFSDPDSFRIDRDPKEIRKHVAFGHGIHACIGAALGRALMEYGLRSLFTRLPGLRLDPDNPARRDLGRFHTRSWETLPVVWAVD
ncbi:MAG TPA: cytochrome P450 [Pseudonocardia sp.]|jgi:cytochrome P450|nr:cytochrome P450 [Pseudonocardia sp.]